MRVPAFAAMIGATFLFVGQGQAMSIVQFDKMADRDQAEYIGNLITGAEKVLTGQGSSKLAGQVKQLFTTKNAGDADTIGMVEFERNLARARLADAKRAESDANAPRLEVEDALAVTLKRNGIELPKSFYSVNANFRPKLPPKQ